MSGSFPFDEAFNQINAYAAGAPTNVVNPDALDAPTVRS